MVLVTGKCKWGHDSLNLTETTVNGAKNVPALRCPLCLINLDSYVLANAGREMHPDRYTAWQAKTPGK